MNIAIFIAVRLKSKRLEKKALAKIGKHELIIHLTNRLKKSNKVKKIIWCTSESQEDDKLCELAEVNNIKYFRGEESNVLSRFIEAAKKNKIKNIVRVTGDNPLTDVVVMDMMIESHFKISADYTYCEDLPIGASSEIMNLKTLEYCQKKLQDPNYTEYMTWVLNRPDRFKVNKYVPKSKKYINPSYSYTVDTKAGLSLMRSIYNYYNKFPTLLKIIRDFNTSNRDNYISRLNIDKNLNIYFKDENRKRFPVIAIVQARTNSTRLPEKINKLIKGEKMLFRVLDRVKRAISIDKVVVALTKEKSDNKISIECEKKGYSVYRGSALNVLSRYYHAAKKFNAKSIVRISADSPVIDPSLIDELVYKFINKKNNNIEYASNRIKRTYPIGTDAEIFSFDLLKKTFHEAKEPKHKEHVTPYMYENIKKNKILSITGSKNFKNIRLTVDTNYDLKLIKKIYNHFSPITTFNWEEIIKFLNQNPEIRDINSKVHQKEISEIDERW